MQLGAVLKLNLGLTVINYLFIVFTLRREILHARMHTCAHGCLCRVNKIGLSKCFHFFSCQDGKGREIIHFLLHSADLVPANLVFKK